MTEDYKEKLIKYMTGNIEPETGANEPQFIDKGEINQNILTYLRNELEYPTIQGYIKQTDAPFYLFYGLYGRNTYNGFIHIVNENFEPIATITEYDSGTAFRPFVTLNFDENGYIYGVDNKNAFYDDTVPNEYRFIMLNNVLKNGKMTGNFTVKLRQSYFFPSNINSQISNVGINGKNRCTKKIGSADYFIFVDTKVNNTNGFGVVSLTINVGESNVWNLVINNDMYAFSILSYFNIYNGDNFSISLGGQSSASSNNYIELTYSFGENPTLITSYNVNNPGSGTINDILKLNSEDTYVTYSSTSNNITYGTLYKVNYDTNYFEQIYEFSKPFVYLRSRLALFNVNGLLFFKYGWYTENGTSYLWNSYIGMFIDDNPYYIESESFGGNIGTEMQTALYINSIYNLITIYSPMLSTTQKIQLVFNQNNCNGLPYEASNCLIPNSGILYDTDDNIIFARNLYNKTVLGATTTSTVQIPNTMLNDTTIGKNDLISETNLTLTEDTTDITKNIYETVNINFANSISIRNDNDPNNTILNPTAAARLNGSTTQNNDYDDVKATKVRVNYTDGTNIVIALNPDIQIKMMSKQVARYQFIIYVNKEVENLQIISFDENTIYQTITGLNIEVNKIYRIVQYISIGQTITSNELLYNGQNVLYNNEQVKYIT